MTAGTDNLLETAVHVGENGHADLHNGVNAQANWLTEQWAGRGTDAGLLAAYAKGAKFSSRLAIDALRTCKRLLVDESRSQALQVSSDSTANDPLTGVAGAGIQQDWPYQVLTALAAAHPALTFQRLVWDDASQSMGRPLVYQTGTAGRLYLDGGTGNMREVPIGTVPHIAGVIDVRWYGRMAAYDVDQILTARSSAAGQRGVIFAQTSTGAGRPKLTVSVDGTAQLTFAANNAATVAADGTDIWLRAVAYPNVPAGSGTCKFYSSVDGITWTQLGTDQIVAGATSWFDNSALASMTFGGSISGLAGMRTYEVQWRDGDDAAGQDAAIMNPVLPDLWQPRTVGQGLTVGAPVFTIVVGGKAGGDIAYLLDPTRKRKLMPYWGQTACLLSQSHNMGTQMGKQWSDTLKTWSDAVQARFPGIPLIYLTQNPELVGAVNHEWHAQRCREIPNVAQVQGRGWIDTYQAVLDTPLWDTTMMNDNVHNNTLGSAVPAAAVLAALASA